MLYNNTYLWGPGRLGKRWGWFPSWAQSRMKRHDPLWQRGISHSTTTRKLQQKIRKLRKTYKPLILFPFLASHVSSSTATILNIQQSQLNFSMACCEISFSLPSIKLNQLVIPNTEIPNSSENAITDFTETLSKIKVMSFWGPSKKHW